MKIYHERAFNFCTYIRSVYTDNEKVKIEFAISGFYIIFFLFQL